MLIAALPQFGPLGNADNVNSGRNHRFGLYADSADLFDLSADLGETESVREGEKVFVLDACGRCGVPSGLGVLCQGKQEGRADTTTSGAG
jgi:hypothetical protein